MSQSNRYNEAYYFLSYAADGTRRHSGIEQRLSQMAIRAIEYDIFGRIPQIFTRLGSVVFSYDHTLCCLKKYLNIYYQKL